MVKIGKTRTKKPRSRSQKFKKAVLGRPQGAIQKRVQAVGPEKFGIVAVDCAKARSKWMLTVFYGNILTPPTNVEHDRSSFQLAVLTLKQAIEKHDIKDIIVAVEMTGTAMLLPNRKAQATARRAAKTLTEAPVLFMAPTPRQCGTSPRPYGKVDGNETPRVPGHPR